MKKFFILLLIIFSANIFAQHYEIGISAGKDFYTVSDLSEGFNLKDLTEAKLTRNGFENPVSFGINFEYVSNENYSLLLEGDFNYLEYNVEYTRNVPKLTNPLNIKTSEYKIPWARLGTMLSFNYTPYSLKNIDFIIGAGLGLQVFAPAVSDKFIINTLFNKLSELDISSDIDLNYSFTQKINAGIKYKLNNSNFNISILSTYTLVNNTVYEAPDNFISIKIILSYVL